MKKSIIAFGILFSVLSVNAKTVKEPIETRKVVKTIIKNLPPLSIAVAKGDYDLTQKFLEFGSDINQKSKVMEMTPLMYAARYNNVKMLMLLVENGAQLKVTSKIGATALDYAKISGAIDAVNYLNSLQ